MVPVKGEVVVANGNVAKSQEKGRVARQQKAKEIKRQKRSKNIGIALASLQIIASIVFVVALVMLNMLPTKYVAILVSLLVLLGVLIMIGQIKSKKNAIAGKMLSLVLTIVLSVGAYYLFQAGKAVEEISGESVKVDNMVVAVLKEDAAETIEDAADYTFGVQYTMKGDEVRTAITNIEEELGASIDVSHEYTNMAEQATALQNGEVQAIIYNSAFAGILEETNPDYAEQIKIIYTHDIETKLEIKEEVKPVEVKDETFTVYISGIDVYGPITTNSRSDVNIIAQVDPATHEVLLVTTPRDFYVEFPNVTGGAKDKLTHAGIYGVDCSMDTLEALYNTEIDFYARVNFTSLIEMVNALGGIDAYSEYAFTTNGGSLTVHEGTNHLNGTQALAFSRERYNVPGGDNQRGKNQQAVIEAMIQKAISPAIITGASGMLESVSDNVDTNMSTEQIQELIKNQIDEGASWNITSVAASGTGSHDYCFSYAGGPLYVMIPDQAVVDGIAQQMKGMETSSAEGKEATEE